MSNNNALFGSFRKWFRKYFMEGPAFRAAQVEAAKNLGPNAPWYTKMVVNHRRSLGVLIPFMFVELIWLSCAIEYSFWGLFPERYYLFITMIFGSFIAGMTGLGGGVVAFPVMTLAFNITPFVARDFSLMIQSVGMSAASFTIFWMNIHLEWCSIIFCSFGAVVGIIIGLEFVDPNLSPAAKKMGFVSVWFAYAVALLLTNRRRKGKVFQTIPDVKKWKTVVLLVTGVIGGVFTALVGTGVNICCFSVLTLLFNVSEKTAMPTSVILLAANSAVGLYWRQVMMRTIHIDSYYYFAVCAPIVALGAPIGSVVGSHFHRQVVATFVCIINTISLISSFAILKLSGTLIGVSVGIILVVFVIFCFLGYLGQRMMRGEGGNHGEELETGPGASGGQVNFAHNEDDTTLHDFMGEKLSNDHDHSEGVPSNDSPTTTL